ncbi:MAG: apolipoprotein N-acyltransferase [Opitutaceae bacterium]|nr:apolipoprotein N-acyltransferase [Verrucomicrobiales bacterium]
MNKPSSDPAVPRWVAPWGQSIWWQRAGWAFSCAAAWVAMEMIRARLLSGFPWNPLGSSQYRQIPIVQLASITGVYGLSFLPVWFAVSLANTFVMFLHKPAAHRSWSGEIILPLVVSLGVAGFGLKTALTPPSASDRSLKIALVQPSIPQNLIFDPAESTNRFRKLIELSIKALESKPDLLIWPEAALPNFSEENFQAITNLVARHKVWMILGADDAEMRPNAAGPGDYDSYNAAFLFSPEGRWVATYRKQRLVIFGEYLPFGDTLPVLRRILPIPGDFTSGKGPVPFQLREPKATIATVICFEDVFPHFVREHVDDGTDFLLNLTNDGWFGESAAQWQQAATALFRAVENGVPLIRCTNNGLTCWIDERGRLRDWLGRESGQVYSAGFMTIDVPLRAADGNRLVTFYRRHGDIFGWSCLGWTALVVARGLLKRRAGKVSGESRS